MATPIISSPTLELRPKHIKMEHTIMNANRLVHKGDYTCAVELYSRLLDERCHPAAYLNRALCYTAIGQPHLAVNDALRAYMMAQAIIDVVRDQAEVNDHIRRIDGYIVTYTDDCVDAVARGEEWCTSIPAMFQNEHHDFKLTRMTLVEDEIEELEPGRSQVISAVEDLKYKGLFRLVDALSRCGAGPAYSALHILGDVLMANASRRTRNVLPLDIGNQFKALAKSIEDKLFGSVLKGKALTKDHQLTQSGFGLLGSAHYGFAERSVNYAMLDNCMLTVDEGSIACYECKFGVPAALVASQNVFKGMVLFTESLPFAVSTANTPDKSELATVCDVCSADLQIPSPFVLRILIEELRQAEAKKTAKKDARTSRREARFKPSSAHHRRTASVDASSFQTPPPSPEFVDKLEGDDARPEKASSNEKEDDDADDDDSGTDSDDEWDSESSSDETDTFSELSVPNTPLRGRPASRPGIFETADIQVCRSGNEKQRENFSFCSVDCYDLAKSTYHDSICGSHIEDYLRKTIMTAENTKLPSVDTQKLVLLLLSRILGWAYATSTDPIDLPIIQMLMASPRYGPLKEGDPTAWSYRNNVLRPFQIFQSMDGRGDAPKSVTNPNYSDGRIINTIISLIHRHVMVTDKILWTKTYDEEGYHEQTYPYTHKPHDEEDERTVFGRLHPLCDLVPLAVKPDDANVELLDLGDGRIICIPTLSTDLEDSDSEACIEKGTRLLLRIPIPRLATKAERAAYARKHDYGEGGTMMDVDQDEGMLEEEDNDDDDDDEEADQEKEQGEDEEEEEEEEEEYSGYVDEEVYGASDDYMDDADWDLNDDDDEDMINF